MNYINKFNTTEEFNQAKETLNTLKHFVAFDVEANKINLKKVIPPLNDASIVGDIVMYDNQSNKMIHCKPSEYSQETYPDSQYTPIGIVVIPSSHTDDGKDVIMSLAVMSAKTPNVGITTMEELSGQTSSNYYLRFGGEGRELTSFTTNDKVPYIASCPVSGKVSDFGDVAFETINEDQSQKENWRLFAFSNDMYSDGELKNPNNTSEGYFKLMIDELKKRAKVLFVPSPYTSSGEKNPQYFQTPEDGGNNILTYFNGSELNKLYLSQIQGGEDWKTNETINNQSGVQDFPYIQCCWRFSTEGTKQGDWYVPTAGECGYVCSKMKEIKEGYDKMVEAKKSVINIIDMETMPVGFWVSNYISDTYGLLFAPFNSAFVSDGGYKGFTSLLSVAFCRVSLRF